MVETTSRTFRWCVLLFFFLMAAPITLPVFGSHDWQRVFQCVVALFLLVVAFLNRETVSSPWLLDRKVRLIAVVLLALAAASIALAHQPFWAVVELALVVTCVGASLLIGHQRHLGGVVLDRLLFILVASISAVKCLQFGAALLAAFVSGFPTLDIDILLEGFSNKRFYGQFQTFTLPLLALPLLSPASRRGAKALSFVLLSCWWMIAISSGTRGTWLAMAGAMAATCLHGDEGRRWVAWQVAATCAGLILFWLFFSLLPGYLGIEVTNFAGDRLNASLSARDIIWQQAWDMIKQRPWLGFGPMHFADIANPVATHPHQAILQWASEWGLPSALLVGGLVIRGLWATVLLIRKRADPSQPLNLLRICLFASLTGALIQAMVDGVIVMPYSQLWLVIVAGWLMGIHEFSAEPSTPRRSATPLWLAGFTLAVGLLGYVVIRDVPHIVEQRRAFLNEYGGRLQPRFWMQGYIGAPPASLLAPMNGASFSIETPK